jgi:hypothetical protein
VKTRTLVDGLGENEDARSKPHKIMMKIDGPPIRLRRDPVEISPEVIRPLTEENSSSKASGPDVLAQYGLQADGALEVGKVELDDDDEEECSSGIPLSEWTGPLSEWIRLDGKEN